MNRFDNIYLIGPMGAGKTTIGRQLARALHVPFYDSDKAIEESTGVDIPTIFEFEGEAGFRKREAKIISELVEYQGIILATGGGAILDEKNRQLLTQFGFVVYLQCSIARILERTRRDNQRPLLNTENPKQKIEKLLIEREPIYLACADLIVDTGRLQSKQVVRDILKSYKAKIKQQ